MPRYPPLLMRHAQIVFVVPVACLVVHHPQRLLPDLDVFFRADDLGAVLTVVFFF